MEPLSDLNNSHTAVRLRPRLALGPTDGESGNKNNNNSDSGRALARGKLWRKALVSKAMSKEADAKKKVESGSEAGESESSTSFRREFCLPPI